MLHKVGRRAFERDEAMRDQWRELAARHQLTFTPGNYQALARPSPAYLHGLYRGRQLKLESFDQVKEEFGKGEVKYTYTRLLLSVEPEPAGSEALAAERPANTTTPAVEPVPPNMVGRLLTQTDVRFLKGEVRLQDRGRQLYYEQRRIETDIAYLQRLLDTLCDLADSYVQLLALGGEAAPALQELVEIADPELERTAGQLLQGIARDTEQRLSWRADQLLCPRCLARFGAHKVSLSRWQGLTYYGCRLCGQSRVYFQMRVVARLDREMQPDWTEGDGLIQVNWLARRTLFDFDAVAIARASNEEVERFAVQVGNDTDPLRQPRYGQMRCAVTADCGLSDNTLRILQHTFGGVEVI